MQSLRRLPRRCAMMHSGNGSRSASVPASSAPAPARRSPGPRKTGACKIAVAGLGIVALTCAALARADPTTEHDAKVTTVTPPMLCEIGSDDATPGVGPNVVCQGSFAQAPPDNDQAYVTASGQFRYRTANIGVGYNHPTFDTLVAGQTYHIQGWTIDAGGDGIRFTHDTTGHGMFIGGDTTVNPF
jgi:hypothetical protein